MACVVRRRHLTATAAAAYPLVSHRHLVLESSTCTDTQATYVRGNATIKSASPRTRQLAHFFCPSPRFCLPRAASYHASRLSTSESTSTTSHREDLTSCSHSTTPSKTLIEELGARLHLRVSTAGRPRQPGEWHVAGVKVMAARGCDVTSWAVEASFRSSTKAYSHSAPPLLCFASVLALPHQGSTRAYRNFAFRQRTAKSWAAETCS